MAKKGTQILSGETLTLLLADAAYDEESESFENLANPWRCCCGGLLLELRCRAMVATDQRGSSGLVQTTRPLPLPAQSIPSLT
jgi:hypothetical protein